MTVSDLISNFYTDYIVNDNNLDMLNYVKYTIKINFTCFFLLCIIVLHTIYSAYLFLFILLDFPGGSVVKNLPAMQEMWIPSLGQEDPLEKQRQPTPDSCLGNCMDRGAWNATVHGVCKALDMI